MITTVTADGKKEYDFIALLKQRAQNSDKNVIPTVQEIIDNVRENGDKAVEEYTVKFDGKAPEKTEITSDEIEAPIISRRSKKQRQISLIFTKDSFSRAGSPPRRTAF